MSSMKVDGSVIKVFIFLLVTRAVSLLIHLDNRPLDRNNAAHKLLSYCIDCAHPENNGSILFCIAPKHGLKEYSVTGEVIYGIPNFGEEKNMLNKIEFRSRIVLVHRGKVELLKKTVNIQSNGAAGVIIVDDGQCNEAFTFCGHRAGSVKEGGFAPMDDESSWKKISIPVCLVTQSSGEKLIKLMDVTRVFIPQYGYQNVTPEKVVDGYEDGDEF
jgi:hypothetical protein